MILKAEALRGKNINNENNRKQTLQRIREAIKLSRNSRHALRSRPERERHRAQNPDAAQTGESDFGGLQQVSEKIVGRRAPGRHDVCIAEEADQECGAAGLDEGDGGEVADMEVVDAVLVGFSCCDLDGSGGSDGDADGDDGCHQRPEDGAEEKEGPVLERVNEDLVAVEREASFLDLNSRGDQRRTPQMVDVIRRIGTHQPEYIGKDAGNHLLPHWIVGVKGIVAEAIRDGAGDGNDDWHEVQGGHASDEDGPDPDDG